MHSQVELWLRANGSPKAPGGGMVSEYEANAAKISQIMQLARASKLQEEVRKLKIANDEKEGRLVDRDDAVVEMREIFAMIRTRLELWPQQMASEEPAERKAEVIRTAQRHVYQLLVEMSGWGKKGLVSEDL